jgi:predicted aldo/keto reductase-like oxidoreductase
MMRSISRRHFLAKTLTGAALTMAAPGLICAAEPVKRPASASDRVFLGKTQIKASLLAQGTGFNGGARSSEHTRMGQAGFESLLRHSFEQGVNFLDMADLYGSHPFVQKTIKGLPRDKFVMLSKIWPNKENWITPSGGAKDEVDRFRKELDTDMLDICLIHCMGNAQWPEKYEKIRDELSELKQKGVVRAVGVSCHDLGALKTAAQHPWTDVIFARINHKGGSEYMMDGSVEEVSAVLKQARANGKAVIGMKIFGAGKLVQPEEKDASLKYVFGNQLVDAITVGMLNKDQIDDTVARLNQALKS